MNMARSGGVQAYRRSRHLFWVAFALATVVSLLLGADPRSGVGPAVGACGVMLLYFLVSYRWTPEVLKHGDFADGFYFLGFLLTLVALVATLVGLGGGNVEEEHVQAVVLARFGFALSTTIVGLVIRTALRMFQDEEGEAAAATVARAQRDLRRAQEDLRGVLQIAATDLETTLTSSTGRIGSSLEGLETRIGMVSGKLTNVGEGLGALATAVGGAERSARSLSSAFEEAKAAPTEFAKHIELVVSGIAELQVPSRNSAEAMMALAGKAAEAANEIGELQRLFLPVKANFEVLESLVARLDANTTLGEGLERMSRSVADGDASLRRFIEGLGGIEAALGKLRRSAEAVDVAEYSQTAELVRRHLAGIHVSLEGWERALGQVTEITRHLSEREAQAAESLLKVEGELTAGVRYLRSLADDGDSR